MHEQDLGEQKLRRRIARRAMEAAEIQAIRETMVRQEAIFKEQVCELHRLYHKQQALFSEAKTRAMVTTRDFFREEKATATGVKRRRTFDLEKLPEENDGEDDDAHEENSTRHLSGVYDNRTTVEMRSRIVEEIPLFPIPNRMDSRNRSEITKPRSTGWKNNLGGVNKHESYWLFQQQQNQQQQQRIQQAAPQWLLQNFGDQKLTPFHFSSNHPWANASTNVLGQGQHVFLGNGHHQNGRQFATAMHYPIPILMNNVGGGGLAQHSWLQQVPPASAYSYFTNLTQDRGERIFPEQQVRSSWNSGSSTAIAPSLVARKPPLVPKNESSISSVPGHLEALDPAGQLAETRRMHKTTVESRKDKIVQKAAENLGVICTAADEKKAAEVLVSPAAAGEVAPSLGAAKAAAASSAKTEPVSEADMTVTDTATILLSLAPQSENKTSKAAASLLHEQSLLSDLKLFKSVAIMLKESGAVKTRKKLGTCRKQQAEVGGGGGGRSSSKAEQNKFQTWIWGDVTRRKRMQRQRPQVHV